MWRATCVCVCFVPQPNLILNLNVKHFFYSSFNSAIIQILWLFNRLNGVWYVVTSQVKVSRKKNWRNDECRVVEVFDGNNNDSNDSQQRAVHLKLKIKNIYLSPRRWTLNMDTECCVLSCTWCHLLRIRCPFASLAPKRNPFYQCHSTMYNIVIGLRGSANPIGLRFHLIYFSNFVCGAHFFLFFFFSFSFIHFEYKYLVGDGRVSRFRQSIFPYFFFFATNRFIFFLSDFRHFNQQPFK